MLMLAKAIFNYSRFAPPGSSSSHPSSSFSISRPLLALYLICLSRYLLDQEIAKRHFRSSSQAATSF